MGFSHSRLYRGNRFTMQKFLVGLLIAGLVGASGYGIYLFCKEREPARIGTIEHQLVNKCISSYTTCYPVTHSDGKTVSITNHCDTHCSAYMCQEHTVRIGKHVWNDETLDIKDLYHGSCRTTGGGW